MKTRFLAAGLILAMAVSALAADSPATFQVSTLTFTRPTSWEWVPTTSMMRKAQLKITDDKTKTSADVVFFHFGPTDGGGVQANVDRWYGQFEEPKDKINAKSETVTVGSHKVTYVNAEGTYRSGMPGTPLTPMADYALAGAIIEDPGGSIFVRMTGPKDLVKAQLPDFKKMVEGPLK